MPHIFFMTNWSSKYCDLIVNFITLSNLSRDGLRGNKCLRNGDFIVDYCDFFTTSTSAY